MSFSYIEWRKHENIRPAKIPNKEKYYLDLENIEHSWTGRIDASNAYIMEAEQLLINAMELFELGYFDCAYYSLRTAIEVSTTMVYLVDMPYEKKKSLSNSWSNNENFPMQSQMLRQLTEQGDIFRDMKERMPCFFKSVRELSQELNKHVHKQGFQHYYLTRNHPIHQKDSLEPFVETFEQYLKRCIGVVAVMRLAIDPFPIVLMDEEILLRCFDSMTDPYSDAFVQEYIGQDVIEEYKNTDIFKGTYDSIIVEEKKKPALFEVYKHHFIDRTSMAEITEQLHLLPREYALIVIMVSACSKIVKAYIYDGLMMFFTDNKTNRKKLSWSGEEFQKFSKADSIINQEYDEVFISVFSIDGEEYYVEHNEKLNQEDTNSILTAVREYLQQA